jgi:hypothetical protein
VASIVVCGDVLRRPRGSNLATHLHYLIGLRKLGHEVVYLEDRGDEDPAGAVPRAGIVLLRELLRRCRVEVPVVWVDPDAGLVGGMVWPQLRRRLSQADLLLDLGGRSLLAERSLARRRVLVELDSLAPDGDHDLRFSNLRHDDGEWLPTIPPVVPRLWYGPPTRAELPLRVTGVDVTDPLLLDLPARVSARPWIAVEDEDLVRAGWSVRSRQELDASLSSHRAGIVGSQALLSFPGQAMWFASEAACFLAAGRPVIVADQLLDGWLPTGTGLVTFSTFDGAVEAVERVTSELPRHAAAARGLADQVFHFRIVLPSLLAQALPARLREVA